MTGERSDARQPDDAPAAAAAAARVLHERARTLAKPAAASVDRDDALEVLHFRLASERYAVFAGVVSEVCTLDDLTPLPCTPAHVRGVLNLRGRVLVVLDIKRLLGLTDSGLIDLHQVIVVAVHGITVGLLADVVDGVGTVVTGRLQPAPETADAAGDCIIGVDDSGTLVLDVERMLGDPALIVDDEVD